MTTKDSRRVKHRDSETNPGRIVLRTGDVIDVAHHFLTEGNQWVCAYENSRDGGIDYRFSAAAVAYIDTREEAINAAEKAEVSAE